MRKIIVATIFVALMVLSSGSVLLTGSAQKDVLQPDTVIDDLMISKGTQTGPRETGSRAYNTTEHMGYTTNAPTIDGTLGPTEWDDAAIYNIGSNQKPVDMYIMFSDSNIYIAVDAISDDTADGGDPPGGQVTSSTTDYFLVSFDGDNDNAITYQNWIDPNFGVEQPSQQPLTRGGICVDRGASMSGGAYRVAGWWHWNLAHDGYSLWNQGAPNQGTQEPFDYLQSGFASTRIYEYSIPYSGNGDQLGLTKGDTVNLGVMINDAKGGGNPSVIGRIPNSFGGVDAPFQPFMLNGKPKAVIADVGDTLVYTGADNQFDASGSSDPEGETITYSWDFDYNGFSFNEMATGASPTHAFANDGFYTVALQVTDTNDASDIKTVTLEAIEPAEPPTFSNILPATDPTIEEGKKQTFSIDFDDLNLDKPDEHLYVNWLVDDDVVKSTDHSSAGSTTYSIQTGYTDQEDYPAGEYKVSVQVNDTYDARGKWTQGTQTTIFNWTLTVTNVNRAPTIDTTIPDFQSSVSTDEVSPLTFKVTASDPDGDNLAYQWRLDDKPQTNAVGNTFVYLQTADYTASGPHKVTVIVSDNGAPVRQAWINWTVIVDDINQLPMIKTKNPTGKSVKIQEGESQLFKITASDLDADDLEYSWFLDGDIIDEAIGTSYTFETDYDSATGEEYKVRIDVTDGKDTDTHEWTVLVTDVDRDPDIIISSPEEGARFKLSDLVTFSARQSTDPDGDPLTFEWMFGDESSKIGSDAKHRYEYPGEYTLELYVIAKHKGQDVEYLRTVNFVIDAATIEVVNIDLDVLEVTQGETVTVTVQVTNSGTIDAEGVRVTLKIDGLTLIETLSDQKIAAGATEEFTFVYKTLKTGVHTFNVLLQGNTDTLIIDEKKIESDELEVNKKAAPGGLSGVGGSFPIWVLILIVIIVIVIIGVAVGSRSGRRKRLAEEERRRLEAEEKQRQEAEAQAAAAQQAAIYTHPSQPAYYQPETLPLPPPPPPPPLPAAASPFTSRRAKRRREKRMEDEYTPPEPEKKVVTPEMAKVAAQAGVCPACGDEVESDWPRCLNCGEKLQTPDDEPEPPKVAPPPPPPPPPPAAPSKAEPSCPKCGEEVEDGWAKCPSCSHTLKAPPSAVESVGPRCGKCNEDVEAEWLKCPSCGNGLKEEAKAKGDPKCPECGEDVEPDWAKCPFCSKIL